MHLWTNSESLKNEELVQNDFLKTNKILVLLSASVERFGDSRIQDFFLLVLLSIFWYFLLLFVSLGFFWVL